MTKEYLQTIDKDQLIIFILNKEIVEHDLRERLFLLTGCRDFGNCDGMNGSCVECSFFDEQLFNRCETFKFQNKCKKKIL